MAQITLEMHIDAIPKGDRVLIHDDVLPPGELKLFVRLVERLGGVIVQVNFFNGAIVLKW
jgi:adenine phosphoribosyltransferase